MNTSPFIETTLTGKPARKYMLKVLGYSIPVSTDEEFDANGKCTVYAKRSSVPAKLLKQLEKITHSKADKRAKVFVFDNAHRDNLTEA